MKLEKIRPYGRVPTNEPGYNFYRSDKGPTPPLQVGVELAPETADAQTLVDAAGFCEGGNYTVFQITDGEGFETGEHLVCAIRDKGTPYAWLVQADKVFQGDGAVDLLKGVHVVPADGQEGESILFNWAHWCSALASVQEARRVLIRTANMFPELKWAMFWDCGDGTGQQMTGQPTDYAKGIRDAVDHGKRDTLLDAARREVEGMN
jgi:hypothetical protein